MTKQFISAVTAMLFLCLAVTAVAEFPTSSNPAKQDWTRINEDGFKGSFKDSCRLIGLTSAECEQFEKMQQGGACMEYDRIPQGRVFDKMAFTKNGENTFMENVRVALTNPQHSSATVCQVGNKAVILPHYCDNLAVVNEWNPTPAVAYKPEAVQPHFPYARSCRFGDKDMRYLEMRVYEAEAAAQSCAQTHMLPVGGNLPHKEGPFGWGNESAFSVSCAEQFDKELYQKGVFGLSAIERFVRFIIIEPTFLNEPPINTAILSDYEMGMLWERLKEQGVKMTADGHLYTEQWYLLFEGTLVGNKLKPASEKYAQMVSKNGTAVVIPDGYETGWVYVEFDEYSTLRTPAPSGIAYPIEKFTRGKCKAMQYVGIDAELLEQKAPAMVLTTSSETEAATN